MKQNTITLGILNLNSLAYLKDQIINLDKLFKDVPEKYYNRLKVLILDNCSDDDSISFLKKKSNNISWLNFYAHPRRISYDENVLSVYKKCTTDYLWLLANDDLILNSNVIIQIFDILDKYKPSGINFATSSKVEDITDKINKQNIFQFKNSELCLDTILKGGKISSNILKKQKVLNNASLYQFVGFGYMHMTLQGWLVLTSLKSVFIRVDEKLIHTKQKWGDKNIYHPKIALQAIDSLGFDYFKKKYPDKFEKNKTKGVIEYKFLINMIRQRTSHCWNQDMLEEFTHNAFFELFHNKIYFKRYIFGIASLMLLLFKPILFIHALTGIFSNKKKYSAPLERL